MYGRPLGSTADCSDPINAIANADCSYTSPSPGAIDWNTVIQQGLTDVTQLLHPGTPSPVPVYTPGVTATRSIFSSPAVWIGVGLFAYLVLKGKH